MGRVPVQEKGTSSFLYKQKYSMLKNVHGRTFFSGVFSSLKKKYLEEVYVKI